MCAHFPKAYGNWLCINHLSCSIGNNLQSFTKCLFLARAACWLWLCCRPLIWAPGWRGAPAWTTPVSQIGTEAPRASASSSLDHYYSQQIKSPKLIFFFPQVLQHIRSNHLPSFRSSSSPKCSTPANTSSHRTLPPGDTCLQGSESDHLSSSLPWQSMCYQLNPSYNSL